MVICVQNHMAKSGVVLISRKVVKSYWILLGWLKDAVASDGMIEQQTRKPCSRSSFSMTNIGDLLGDAAKELLQSNADIGDVHLPISTELIGITPKNGDATRNKFFIVLGFDNEGNVIGGLVINSKINYNLPSTVTDYQLPITVKQCSFLQHNSFVNCSKIIVAKRDKV